MTTADLIRWAGTSRENCLLVGKEFRLRLGRLLNPFTSNVNEFLTALDKHHSIISGSVALAVATGDADWTPGDLDIYVPYDQFLPVIQYMQVVEGYELIWDKTKNSLMSHLAQQARNELLATKVNAYETHRFNGRTTSWSALCRSTSTLRPPFKRASARSRACGKVP